MFVVRGIKAWIVTLIALVIIVTAIVIVFNILLFLIPLILIIVVIGYLFRMLNKFNKGKGRKPTTSKRIDHEYIDVKYKVKKK
jgi:hypothetical protein